MMAAHWIASGHARGKKALVVCADQSRSHIGKPWEFVLGAASVAMLISDQPDFLEFELDTHGYWTQEISDTYRPTSRDEVGHAETSLFGYLEAVEGSCEHFMSRAGTIDYDQHFARHVYHVPFGALTWRGHRAVSRRWQPEYGNKQIHETFERKSKPGLRYNRRFGGTYTSATFLALMGTIASAPELRAGERVKVGERAHEVVADAKLDAGLDARRKLSVPEYETLERARALQVDNPEFTTDKSSPSGHWQQAYEGRQLCVLDGVHAWERSYQLS
jgi:hydroxymethylglutaryl-CoA synthase